VGKGSLGRFSVATDISAASSAATRHWVNSVSDIYGPDEIEDLLQDLNRLELAALDTEDYREFELAASSSQEVGGGGALALRRLAAGSCRSYAAAAQRPVSSSSSCEVSPPPPTALAETSSPGVAARLRPSPAHSVRSWDSHTHYQQFKERMSHSARVHTLIKKKQNVPHI
jgi:hypothetical protein